MTGLSPKLEIVKLRFKSFKQRWNVIMGQSCLSQMLDREVIRLEGKETGTSIGKRGN